MRIRGVECLPVVAWVLALCACGGDGDSAGRPDAGSEQGGGGDSGRAGGGRAGTGGSGGSRSGGSGRGGSGETGAGGGGSGGRAAGSGGSGGRAGSGGAAGGNPGGGGGACRGITSAVTSPTASGADVAVTVSFADTGCRVAPDFVGTNYEAFSGWGADVSMNEFQERAFAEAGVQLFRFPGGAPGDWVELQMTGTCEDGTEANWGAPSYGELWEFAQAAGVYSLMLQTNPTPQWCGSGDRDASGARVGEVAAEIAAQGVRTVFEVGNEPDIGDSWFMSHGGRDAYIAKFIEHAKAIHEAMPGAEVYGPVVCGLGANCSFPTTWDSGWLDAFLAETGDQASGEGKGTVDGVSFHIYWHNEWGFSDLEEAGVTKYGFAYYWSSTVMPYLRDLIAEHDSRDLPIAISEISIGNGVPNDGPQRQNMFTVLGTLDTIAAFAGSGLRSFQWFDANAEGPADFWMITRDATRPIYYAFVAWSKMGDHVLELSSDANPVDIGAYATKRDDGSVQVLLINKTDSSHDVALGFDGFDPSGKPLAVYSAAPASAGSDSATSVIYNGAADPLPGALPPPNSSTNVEASPVYALPAYSLAVLVFGP